MIWRGMRRKSKSICSLGRPMEALRDFVPSHVIHHLKVPFTPTLVASGFLLTLVASPQAAQAFELNYGGWLADENGAPISGPIAMTFRFYAEASGGTAIHSTQVPNVELVDGMFQVPIHLTDGQIDGRR